MKQPGQRATQVKRAVVGVGGAFVAFLLLIELLARWNVRREQQERAYLGDRLYAEVVGERGDPIVFIAGLQGSTRYWNHGFDALARDRRVIYVDLLGFGRSPWPKIDYTLDDHLAALQRTLAALDATCNVTIVAHSFGAVVAAHYAARFPDQVSKLYLLGAPVYANEKEARERIRAMSPLAAMFSLRPFLARETCLLMGSTRPLLRRVMPRLMPDVPAAVAEDAVLHTWPSFRGAMQNILLAHPIAEPLRTIGPKAVFVHGTRDTITPLASIRALARTSGATVLVLDSDHHGYARGGRHAVTQAIAADA